MSKTKSPGQTTYVGGNLLQVEERSGRGGQSQGNYDQRLGKSSQRSSGNLDKDLETI